MGLKQAILELHSTLKAAEIEHALIGGFALAVHGINRATGDIDLLVDETDKSALTQSLMSVGYRLVAETPEVLHFQGPARVDILLARRPVSKKMLANAKKTALLEIKCLGPEDLIGLKIQAYCNNPKRELQDKADIQFLLNRYPDLDLETVQRYADVFGQWETIQGLRNTKS